MSIRTGVFALVCALVVAVAAVTFSWTVGPHENLATAADLVLSDDSFDVSGRNWSPWCWTGSCPQVTAASTIDATARSVERDLTAGFLSRNYTLSRRSSWLIATRGDLTIEVQYFEEADRTTSLDWVITGS